MVEIQLIVTLSLTTAAMDIHVARLSPDGIGVLRVIVPSTQTIKIGNVSRVPMGTGNGRTKGVWQLIYVHIDHMIAMDVV